MADVAVVTGGARGIGLAITEQLLETGWDVVVVDVNEKAVRSLDLMIEAADGRLEARQLSITDRGAVTAAIREVERDRGPVGALVNNAGMTLPGTFLDQNDEDWDRIVAVNLTGPFVMAQVTARAMVQRGSGSIVNISSVSAHGVRTGPPAYAAAKAGVEGLSRLIAVQLGAQGVRCNTIVVGTTATPWLLGRKTDEELDAMRAATLTGKLGEPGDVAALVSFLCSAAAKHITGQLISVSGGQWMP